MLDPQSIMRKFIDKIKESTQDLGSKTKAENKPAKIQLLKDAYDLDQELQHKKNKHMSLKMLEEQKKIYNYAQQWKKEQAENQKNMEHMAHQSLIQQEDQKKEMKQIIQFLHPDFRLKFL